MATKLTDFANSGIRINPDFIDSAVLNEFANKPLESLTLEQAKGVVPSQSETDFESADTEFKLDDDLDSILNKLIESLKLDADIGTTITENQDVLRAQSKQNILDSVISKPTDDLIKNNQNSLIVTKEENQDGTSFIVNGELIAVIPAEQRNSPLAVSVEMIIAWTFLIWHSVSFIATVIGFAMPSANNSNVKGVSTTVGKQASTWSKFIARMKKIAENISANEKVKRFVFAFKVISLTKNLGAIVKAILSHMSAWRIALAVLDFLASVALMFVTAGAEVIRKMIKMAQLLVNVIQDVVSILDLEKRTSTANAA